MELRAVWQKEIIVGFACRAAAAIAKWRGCPSMKLMWRDHASPFFWGAMPWTAIKTSNW
jgi:hypothetical protein